MISAHCIFSIYIYIYVCILLLLLFYAYKCLDNLDNYRQFYDRMGPWNRSFTPDAVGTAVLQI